MRERRFCSVYLLIKERADLLKTYEGLQGLVRVVQGWGMRISERSTTKIKGMTYALAGLSIAKGHDKLTKGWVYGIAEKDSD
jgi:hypothetical protein